MAIKIYNEASLNNSEIWQMLNENDEVTQKTKAANYISSGKKLSLRQDLETAYITLNQEINMLVKASIKAVEDEEIILIYNPDTEMAVTQGIPFINFKSQSEDKWKTYIFMNVIVKTLKGHEGLTVQIPKLRDLMLGSLISNRLKTNYQVLSGNITVQKILMNSYERLFFRIINRKFMISPNKIACDSVSYWVNRFFLERIFESQDSPEGINLLAKKDLKYIGGIQLSDIINKYDESNPQKLSELLELIKTASPNMKTLGKDTFIGEWITYYHYPSTLAIDNIDYLIFMLLSLYRGTNIINFAAKDIINEVRNFNNLEKELYKLI